MILTELYHGQGLGNQLHVYVTTRVIAEDRGVEFGLKGLENLGDRRYNNEGLYFMDLYLGEPVDDSKIVNHYQEKELRLITNNSHHDSTLGCDIRLSDPDLAKVPDNCKIDGTMQSEDYIYHRKEDIKQWLKLKPEHDNKEFTDDNICVLNIRDYEDNATIKKARWLILSNSSFAYFPALTNEEARLIIAPKYWARHNVSDGYWCTGVNLYRDFIYMDKQGNLQSYDECKREFELYIQKNAERYKQYIK